MSCLDDVSCRAYPCWKFGRGIGGLVDVGRRPGLNVHSFVSDLCRMPCLGDSMIVGMNRVHLALGLTQDGESGMMCGSAC